MEYSLHRNRDFIIIVILIVFFLDMINISDIISIPFNNINLDLWNIVVVVILYILTYVIIDKKDNNRKKNQEDIAKILLEQTYKECCEYEKLIDNKLFKEICSKRFPGDQTMENNVAYNNLREAPFEHDSIIYSLGQDGIISAIELQHYINVKNKYHIFFSNVVCFPDLDEMTNPLRSDLEREINIAIRELGN